MDDTKITKPLIIGAALRLLREDGIEKLTMRKLATRLNIRAPTLYWYFPDRSSILREIIKSILTEAVDRVSDATTWQDWLKAFALSIWKLNCETPYATLLLQSAELNDESVVRLSIGYIETIREKFDVDAYILHRAHSDVQALVMGWSVFYHAKVTTFINPDIDVENALREGIDSIVQRWDDRLKQQSIR